MWIMMLWWHVIEVLLEGCDQKWRRLGQRWQKWPGGYCNTCLESSNTLQIMGRRVFLSRFNWCVCKFNNSTLDCNADNWQSLYKGRCNKDSIVVGTDVGVDWMNSVSNTSFSRGIDRFSSCDWITTWSSTVCSYAKPCEKPWNKYFTYQFLYYV